MPTRLPVGGTGLNVAGLVPFSTVDWPGHLVASVFAQGCPFRCPYCHNHEILDPRVKGDVSWDEVTELLQRRRGLLDGVVFSGGEALMQAVVPRGFSSLKSPLGEAMAEVKEMGFKVGLHVAGSFPDHLRRLLDADLVDWVGLDIKALPQDYQFVTASPIGARLAEDSLRALVDYPEMEHEVRLTLWPGLLRAPSMGFIPDGVPSREAGRALLNYAVDVARWSHERGARVFALQRFQERTAQDVAKGENIPRAKWDDDEACFRLQQVGFKSVQVR